MVPKDKVTRLRMKLAEAGLPKGGGVGYEIFDKSDALGTTSFVQNINRLRALEGELSRTIRPSTASRMPACISCCPTGRCSRAKRHSLRPRSCCASAAALEPQQIRAIRHLVASAVNGLKPQRVSIVDEAGQLLADGAGDRCRRRRAATSGAPHSKSACAIRSKRSCRRWSEAAAPASSSPPTSITTRSPRPRTSSIRKAGCCARARPARNPPPPPRATARSPSTTSCPATSDRTAPTAARDQSKKSEETNNYEISRTTKTEVTEAGRVNRISVAVLVDGSLYEERQRRDGLCGRAARNSSIASRRWCARPSASIRSAATRSRSSTCNSPKRLRSPRSRSRPACSACCSSPRTT